MNQRKLVRSRDLLIWRNHAGVYAIDLLLPRGWSLMVDIRSSSVRIDRFWNANEEFNSLKDILPLAGGSICRYNRIVPPRA